MPDFLRVIFNVVLAGLVTYIFIKLASGAINKVSNVIDKFNSKTKKLATIIAAVLIIAWPFLMSGFPYILRTSIMMLMYVVLALSLNFILGFAGQLSMGHAAFYGIGAYTTALLMVNLGFNFWISLILSCVVSGIFGFILGMPTLRLKGDYLAITTIGFCEIVKLVLINWIDLTRGPAGIPGIPAPKIFGYTFKGNIPYYYLILIFAIVTILISKRLLYSRLGRGLRAVRDDEVAAEAMGINIIFLKVLAFILGACIAGAAGSFFSVFIRYINPDNFTYMESVSILCMVVLGGVGNITGVVFGAIILTILPEALRDISTYRYVIYGMLLIMMMIIRPNGLIGVKGGNSSGKSTGAKRSNKIIWRANSGK